MASSGSEADLAPAALAVVGLALWAGAFLDQPGSQMGTAADRFLAALSHQGRALVTFDFDPPERLNWHSIPLAQGFAH